MFDKVTTLTISYSEFFEIFAQTKRILVGVAMNPKQKNIAHQMNYKIIMLKIDLFFMNRIHGVFINWCFYKLIKPVGGIIYCIFKYILGGTVIILKNLLNKQKEIKKS